jgi:hypothetical protein
LDHDEEYPTKTCHQTQKPHHPCLFSQEDPAEYGQEQGQHTGNDRRQSGFDPLHGNEIEAKVKCILANADDDHPTPFLAFKFDFLAHHPGQCDAQKA